ncbi:hypothetical protein ACFTZI_23650 [Streptomyces decoyicus]|uniref:hypothetical protein n=1 Tax=Streptomyces decoyicus TaxID=249567 RepID=UPI00362539CE
MTSGSAVVIGASGQIGRAAVRALAQDGELRTVAVDAAMGAPESEIVRVDGAPPSSGVGDTPWSAPHPLVCDLTAAERELAIAP